MAQARQCPQCAATVNLPPDRIADRCAFCGAALVDFAADDEPIDRVVPFVLDEARARAALAGWRASRWIAPEALRAGPPDRLTGVLVPFYAFDGSATSAWAADIAVKAGRSTVTHAVTGGHVAAYHRELVSGSRGVPEHEANALEPFDLGRALPYAPALTAGWIAERPDVDHTTADQVAAREVADRENHALAHGYLPGSPSNVRNTTTLDITRVELVLLPVWIATWRHGGRRVRLLVNGQTGEVVGSLPRSPWKIGLLVTAVTLPFLLGGALAALVALLVWAR